MTVTEEMRLQRALQKLEELARAEREAMASIEGCNIREIIIARNRCTLHIAEIAQIIRNTREKLNRIREGETA